MSISASMVADLRKRTGSGIKDCSKALKECDGDMDKAVEYLRKKGLSAAENKAGRDTGAGRIFSYIHSNGLMGTLLELGCETDFVANTEQFQNLGRDLCMHVCAMSPQAVSRESMPQDIVEREKEIFREQLKDNLKGKKKDVQEKILSGKMDKYYKEQVLMEQSFVKDDKQSIEAVIKSNIATLKENIKIKRFVRYQCGE